MVSMPQMRSKVVVSSWFTPHLPSRAACVLRRQRRAAMYLVSVMGQSFRDWVSGIADRGRVARVLGVSTQMW